MCVCAAHRSYTGFFCCGTQNLLDDVHDVQSHCSRVTGRYLILFSCDGMLLVTALVLLVTVVGHGCRSVRPGHAMDGVAAAVQGEWTLIDFGDPLSKMTLQYVSIFAAGEHVNVEKCCRLHRNLQGQVPMPLTMLFCTFENT